jgi:hypothetical protein
LVVLRISQVRGLHHGFLPAFERFLHAAEVLVAEAVQALRLERHGVFPRVHGLEAADDGHERVVEVVCKAAAAAAAACVPHIRAGGLE